MTTILYENFKNGLSYWTGTGASSSKLILVNDPLNQMGTVGSFSATTYNPTTYTAAFWNPSKTYTLTFDYLGFPRNNQVSLYLGFVISVSDGGSLTDLSNTIAASINTNSALVCPNLTGFIYPRDCSWKCDYWCIEDYSRTYRYRGAQILADNSQWNHYSLSFSTTSEYIRLAIADYVYANYPETALAGDVYIANLLLTDSNGPSSFIATVSAEQFKAISVTAINKVADEVSYQNSNVGVRVFLDSSGYGGFAEGDTYNGINSVIGSSYDDQLYGNAGNNTLNSASGNDYIQAGTGNDRLIGGGGSDTFVITQVISQATIDDFSVSDLIDLRAFTSITSLSSLISVSSYISGKTTVNLGNNKSLVLIGADLNNFSGNNFIFFVPSTTPTASISKSGSTSLSSSSTASTSHTSSKSVTPSVTPTISITSSVTPTESTTPSATPTISVTPSITPTTSVTPSITPTTSVTPSITPTSSITPLSLSTSEDNRLSDALIGVIVGVAGAVACVTICACVWLVRHNYFNCIFQNVQGQGHVVNAGDVTLNMDHDND